MPPVLQLHSISKTYPDGKKKAVNDITFSVEKGEILALVGESGSGKTTLLRTIAGLEQPDTGALSLSGHVICDGRTSVPPHLRNIGMVFQDYALFPHMTIAENIGFGIKGKSNTEKKAIIDETLALTGLNESLSKYPHQLSGGQQQRVALARALAPKPSILLLDEPFSNLDTILHDRIREDLRKIVKSTGITTILVTHHTRDALCMADKVAVIHEGNLLQTDTPESIYTYPVSGYVANLFGKYSCISYERSSQGIETAFGRLSLPFPEGDSEAVRLFFRPEQVKILPDPVTSIESLHGTVISSSFLGDYVRIVVKSEPFRGKTETLVIHSGTSYPTGASIRFAITPLRPVNFGDFENE